MEEEIYIGTGISVAHQLKQNTGPNTEDDHERGFEEEYFQWIFNSCNPNNAGLVRVSTLLGKFHELGQSISMTDNNFDLHTAESEPLEVLKTVLDPINVNPQISRDQFIKCVQECVGSQSTTSSPRDTEPLPLSPKGYSNEQDESQNISKLGFQINKLTSKNAALIEQLSAMEDERTVLLSKKDMLEKLERKHALCDFNKGKISQELNDVKAIMGNYEAIITDLRIRMHHLERENNDLSSTNRQYTINTDSLITQLQSSVSEMLKKNKELEKAKLELQIKIANSALKIEEKQNEIQQLECNSITKQSFVDKLLAEKHDLEVRLTNLEGELKEQQKDPATAEYSELAEMSAEIEIDDIGHENTAVYYAESLNSSMQSVSTNCSNCTILKNSLQEEYNAAKKDLWRPESESMDKNQSEMDYKEVKNKDEVKKSIVWNTSKKGVIMALMLTTVICGLRGIINCATCVNDNDNLQVIEISSFASKFGSLIHNERPII